MSMESEVKMESRQAETDYEKERLENTIAVAEQQLRQAEAAMEARQAEIVDMKKYAREKNEFSMADLSNPEAFDAFVELSQFDSLLTKMSSEHDEDRRNIRRLRALMKNPYFARIDFIFEGEETPEQIYIGRSPLTEKASHEIYVYDWRSPIAGVFYRFMTGNAFYDAPNGRIFGEVVKKRQYEIRDGVLQYFFDTDRNINDEILRQILSQNASPKMKAIVETIQKDQDSVIRNMENDLLMVQGVAGSGKTSIALHRAAYLMYQGLQERLSAGSILILSPNSAFEEYISGVLPELGEQNVGSATFDEILRKILGDRKIQSHADFLESLLSRSRYRSLIKSCVEFKTSDGFLRILDRFTEDIPLRFLHFSDLKYHGEPVVTQDDLRKCLFRNPQTPLGTRLKQLETFVLERIFGAGRPGADREEYFRISQALQGAANMDIPALYLKLFQTDEYFDCLAEDAEEPGNLQDIRRYTAENLTAGLLQYDDALAMAYMTLKIYGDSRYRNIKQVLIDEAQDYYPLQYEMFRLLFPGAKFTVLGDVSQTLARDENLSLYEEIPARLRRSKSSLVILDKSFRCTSEILDFSLRFLPGSQEITSFNRSGSAPKSASFGSREELLREILTEIRHAGESGLKSVCLLCKTADACKSLHDELKSRTDIELIQDDGAENLQGTFLMPVYLSKGLEFDAVIVCDASRENYPTEEDRKLLYVECTRALHRLAVFCEGEPVQIL